VNIALALAERGATVRVLDADVYGPNIPLMVGLTRRPLRWER
jgi:ATP-binding protein involved in chromosome partitioning